LYHIIVSCEHAKNTIPKPYARYFRNASSVLSSHRGYDIGALFVAKHLASALNAPLFITEVSRLLVDCNRSIHNPKIFSEYTKVVSEKEKLKIINRYYRPYRKRVEEAIQNALSLGKKVLHLSIHTFTPRLGLRFRDFDIGVLYDPDRYNEAIFSRYFLHALRAYSYEEESIFAKIKRVLTVCTGKTHHHALANKPYKGTADGLTSYLRRQFFRDYLGIEIEVNQIYFD
jgi:predicted N-formylglutamate amidohydrolase